MAEQQAAKIAILEARIKSLESNSRNSSKPPSSDKGNHTNPPKPKSLRGRSGKKRGGQKGHKGSTLNKTATPDHIEKHHLPPDLHCPKCQQKTVVTVNGHKDRQVFDLPPITIQVTEHRAEQCQCQHCNTTITAPFPEHVIAPTQYGPNLQAICVYLNSYQLIPYKRLAESCADLFGVSLSQGTIANMVSQAGKQANEVARGIADTLAQGSVLHGDETGCRLNGKRHWLHVASNAELTFYHFDLKRGYDAMVEMGVIPRFKGHLIHDCLGAYHRFIDCQHGLCNAHALRELTYALEELDQPWAKDLIDLLLEAKKLTEEHPEGLSKKERTRIDQSFQKLIEKGLELNPEPEKEIGKRGRVKRSKQLNLLRRLDKYRDEFLAFVNVPDVPFDNNQAERDLRMMKTREKISGGFGSEQRAQDFCRLRSVISSAIKQKKNILQTISTVISEPQRALDSIIGVAE